MAEAREPSPVKLICGMISARREVLTAVRKPLEDTFGPADLVSDVYDFDLTDYYADQMGGGLLRQFLSFRRTVSPNALAAAKITTNAIETDFAGWCDFAPRPVNLDVGYVTEAKLVLASMKDFAHRVYLGAGVHAEVTLLYRGGGWMSLEWTFPDYASGRYDTFLTGARRLLREGECQ